MSEITPSQTVGPFFAYGLTPKGRCHWDPNGSYSWKETVGDNLITPDATGQKIHIEGRITDGDGLPINDSMIEIWQADAQGRYAHARGEQPRPNAKFTGFGRSATDKSANAADPILAMVPADRRGTLIAHKETRDGLPVYRFDIRVQGDNETVFFLSLIHISEPTRRTPISYAV